MVWLSVLLLIAAAARVASSIMVVMRSMAVARPASPPSLIQALPHDITVKIVGLVAATSPRPMDDLCSLRASCRAMHAACSDRTVGRLVALEWEAEAMRWADHDRYLAVVGSLSGTGNPEACFLAGITLIFVHRYARPGAKLLSRSTAAGHKVATYVLAVLRYTYNVDVVSDDVARRVEDDEATKNMMSNKECVRCRAQAVEAVRQATWNMVELPAMAVPTENTSHRCKASGCGAQEAWSDSIVFCNEDCRIRFECAKFMSQLPLTVANFVA